ncbi:hypothetical protein GQR58_025368 [Nymphon striatum]|nr:hypothetical protein GQR58_025368 [Nymphon striatum]
MKCDATTMTAVVTVDPSFKGRIYAMSHPYGCFSVPSFSKQDELFLTMPLWGKQCGTNDLGNGTFSNSIIIQEHPYILRNTDKRVEVYCDYDVIKQKLRSGKEVIEGNDVTEIQSTITGVVPTPRILLRIVNETDEEVTGVALGQNLKLKVEIMDENVFGIFGSDLIAKSGDDEEYIRLIDDKGCPIEPTVFPSLKVEKGRKTLSSDFKAFKFATNPLVKFELKISFCLEKCLPVDCASENELESASYGRRRKRSSRLQNDYKNGEVVTDVRMQKTLLIISDLKSSSKERLKWKKNIQKGQLIYLIS